MPRLLPFLALLALAAPAPAADERTPRQKGDLAIRARHILKTYCHQCHGGEKQHGRFVALNHLKVVAKDLPIPFVVPNKPDESQIIHFVEDGSMPPGGRKRPPAEDRKVLKDWIEAGAPSYPAAFDDAFIASEMLADLRGQKPEDVRYFSFVHLLRDDAVPNLEKAADELNAALAALDPTGPKDRKVITPVGDTATLYRFDLRTLGWDNRELFDRVEKMAPAGVYASLTAYDLLLLEYPLAPAPDPQLGRYLADAKLARPVPFLRGDWVSRALLGEGSPLAEDLRHLTAVSRAAGPKNPPPVDKELLCGTPARAFAGRNPVPAAPPGAPLAAWYSGDIVPQNPSFDIRAEIDLDGKAVTTVTTADEFRLKVTTDRKVWFVLLLVQSDGLVRVHATNKNRFLPEAGEHALAPGPDSPFRIVAPGTEYFVLFAAERELPTPVVVQSRRPAADCADSQRLPVHRFLFDDKKLPKDFDPSRVVRRVIPVVVTKPE